MARDTWFAAGGKGKGGQGTSRSERLRDTWLTAGGGCRGGGTHILGSRLAGRFDVGERSSAYRGSDIQQIRSSIPTPWNWQIRLWPATDRQ